MQIDHDPNELSHRALKAVGVVTLVGTLAVMIPLGLGMRWIFERLPFAAIALFDGIVFGACIGFFFGRRDVIRQMFPDEPWLPIKYDNVVRILKRCSYLLPRVPFAIVLLPLASWRKARNEGDGRYVRIMSAVTGLVLGFAITAAFMLLVTIPVIVATGN